MREGHLYIETGGAMWKQLAQISVKNLIFDTCGRQATNGGQQDTKGEKFSLLAGRPLARAGRPLLVAGHKNLF